MEPEGENGKEGHAGGKYVEVKQAGPVKNERKGRDEEVREERHG